MNFSSITSNKKLPLFLAAIGLVLFIAQTILFTQIRMPNMDEGAYLFKGLEYARGATAPFEPFSFWTNKMYLTFYLFGWVQVLFGPGLLTSRIFAAVLSTASVVGIWMMARRFSNNWIAAAAVWAMALNPSMISIYSIGNSQVVVIFFLVWSLVFSLGSDRKIWELITGAILASITVLCRENMVFLLPLLTGYIFWQHGLKKGFIALASMGTAFLIGHLIFWPEILSLWDKWLPFNLVPEAKFTQIIGLETLKPTSISRLHSLSLAIRVFAVPAAILLITVILWVKKSSWKSDAHFKTAVFLLVLLVVLIASHTWASIGNDYCVYCTTNYFAFFIPITLVLVAVGFGSYTTKYSGFRLIPLFLLFLSLGTLIGFSYFEAIGYKLMKIPVPRMAGGRFLPGTVELWQLLINKFQIDYEMARLLLPSLLGFVLAVAVLFFVWLIYRSVRANKFTTGVRFLSLAILVLALVLSPVLSWPDQEQFSSTSVPTAFKVIGETLDQSSKPNDKVYIDGGTTAIPLLYVDDVEYLPAQINLYFSFVSESDSDMVAQNGFWNRQIAASWQEQSKLFLIEQSELDDWTEYIQRENILSIPIEMDYSKIPTGSRIFLFLRP